MTRYDKMYKLLKRKKIGIITVILTLFILTMGIGSNSFFIPRDEVEPNPSFSQITLRGGLNER